MLLLSPVLFPAVHHRSWDVANYKKKQKNQNKTKNNNQNSNNKSNKTTTQTTTKTTTTSDGSLIPLGFQNPIENLNLFSKCLQILNLLALHRFCLSFQWLFITFSWSLSKHLHVTVPNPQNSCCSSLSRTCCLITEFFSNRDRAGPANSAHRAASEWMDSTAVNLSNLCSEICSSQATYLNTSVHFPRWDGRV